MPDREEKRRRKESERRGERKRCGERAGIEIEEGGGGRESDREGLCHRW